MTRSSIVSLFALAGLALSGCAPEAPPTEPRPRPVRTIVVSTAARTAPAVLAGVAKAGLESNLSFRVGGTLTELPASVGRNVRRGELLARLDPIDYELQLEESKASLAQAQATLRQAIADYARIRALYENNNAAKSDLDAARAAFESAEAHVEASDKRLAQSARQVDYTVLRAPVAGAIAAVDVELNETISAGQAVVRLTSGSIPEIEVAVSEITIPFIVVGMQTTVRFDAIPKESFRGTVLEVGVATAGAGSTYPVTVKLDRSNPMIRSGMAAEVAFPLDASGGVDRILVPPVAIGEDQNGRFAFVVDDRGDGTAIVKRREVEVGDFTGQGIEILSGIDVGDVLVTAGVRRLADGMLVQYSSAGF